LLYLSSEPNDVALFHLLADLGASEWGRNDDHKEFRERESGVFNQACGALKKSTLLGTIPFIPHIETYILNFT